MGRAVKTVVCVLVATICLLVPPSPCQGHQFDHGRAAKDWDSSYQDRQDAGSLVEVSLSTAVEQRVKQRNPVAIGIIVLRALAMALRGGKVIARSSHIWARHVAKNAYKHKSKFLGKFAKGGGKKIDELIVKAMKSGAKNSKKVITKTDGKYKGQKWFYECFPHVIGSRTLPSGKVIMEKCIVVKVKPTGKAGKAAWKIWNAHPIDIKKIPSGVPRFTTRARCPPCNSKSSAFLQARATVLKHVHSLKLASHHHLELRFGQGMRRQLRLKHSLHRLWALLDEHERTNLLCCREVLSQLSSMDDDGILDDMDLW